MAISFEDVPSTPQEALWNGLHAASLRIITCASWDYLDLLENWAHWVKRLGFRDFTVIAEDSRIFQHLQALSSFPHVIHGPFELLGWTTDDLARGEAVSYDEPGFLHLMSRRAAYLQYLLNKWSYILFSDADVIWLRNPLYYMVGDADVEVSVDTLERHHGMLPYFCPGFMLLHNSSATRGLLTDWHGRLQRTPQLNQPAFNVALRAESIDVRALDVRLFASGLYFFLGGLHGRCRGQAVTGNGLFDPGRYF